jgi:hypothetical protein
MMPTPQTLVKQIYDVKPKEVLTGWVQGKKASDIEERTARALSKLPLDFTFQMRINALMGVTETKMNLPGEVEIDFLVQYMGTLYPINVQGEISHFFASWQQVRDAKKKIIIDAALRAYNAHELIVVPYTKLVTQETADSFYRYGVINGWPTAYYQTL